MVSTCEAVVQQDWHSFGCSKRATTERGDWHLCGVHARQYDRWDSQGRAESMADYWWRVR